MKEKKKKKKEKASSGSAKPNSTVNSSLNAVTDDNDDQYDALPLCAYFGAPERWLVDSGATNHMTLF